MTFLSIFLSIFACFLWIAVYSVRSSLSRSSARRLHLPSRSSRRKAQLIALVSSQLFPTFFFDWELIILYSTMNFWATVVVVIVLAIGPHFLYRGVMGFFFP